MELEPKREMETKLLGLWIGSLRAYRPKVEPEAGHFDGLIEWLESYIGQVESNRKPVRRSDCTGQGDQ